jgi:hypothetical protein
MHKPEQFVDGVLVFGRSFQLHQLIADVLGKLSGLG